MIIKNLKLKNYRRFKNVDLELPENIIGIVGNNGVGKTTIVEAIGWCLYGNRIRRTDKQDIRSQFCDSSDECVVEMIFSCQENEYRITRKLKGKTAIVEAAIYMNSKEEPEAVQERGVNEYIENLLNLDYRSFFISVFAKQKDLAALSTLQPEERRKSIARLINIEAIDAARLQIRTDRKSKQDIQKGIESSLKDDKELKVQKKQLKLELDSVVKSKKDISNQLIQIQDQHKTLLEEFEKLNKLRDEYFQVQGRIEKWNTLKKQSEDSKKKHVRQIEIIKGAQKELDLLKPQLKDLKKVATAKEKLDKAATHFFQQQAMLDEKKRLDQLISREHFKLTKLSEELKGFEGIENRIETNNEKFNHLETQREQLRQELSKVEGLILNVKNIGQELKQKKEKIENLGQDSPCPVCTRPLENFYDSVVAHFEKELSGLRQKYSENEKSKKGLVSKIQQTDILIKEAGTIRDGLLQALQQNKELEKQLSQTRETHAEFENNLKELRKKIGALGKIEYNEKEHREYKKRFKELDEIKEKVLKYEENVKRLPDEQNELDQIENSLKEFQTALINEKQLLEKLNYDEEKYLRFKKDVTEKQHQLDFKKDEVHKIERKIVSIEKDKERVADDISTAKKLKQKITEIKEEVYYLEVLDEHFGIFRQELAGRIRPLIANRASELLGLTTQGRYSIMELDEDYNIFLYDQTAKFPLARFSGGEQDMANLCLRIAISRVVAERSGRSQINFIVLDEIFGSQDEQRKELILFALQQLSSQFRQIFIITHVEGIKDSLPVIVSVEEKSTMESRAKLM
jgi:DNA repair protein SbcC/Rad50